MEITRGVLAANAISLPDLSVLFFKEIPNLTNTQTYRSHLSRAEITYVVYFNAMSIMSYPAVLLRTVVPGVNIPLDQHRSIICIISHTEITLPYQNFIFF